MVGESFIDHDGVTLVYGRPCFEVSVWRMTVPIDVVSCYFSFPPSTCRSNGSY